MNIKTVRYFVGKMLQVEAALLALPLIVSFIYQESHTQKLAYAGTILMLLVIGSLLSFKKPEPLKIMARDGVVTVALSWILLSFFGGLPFVFTGEIPNVVDAFFETASGLTTTGSSIIPDLSVLAHSSLFWRSFTHLVGGMGVLVFALAILPSHGSESVQLMRAEVPGPVFGKLVSKLAHTAQILYMIYLAMTAVLVIILGVFQVPLFDALLLAFGTAGTGGFGINNAGFSIYANPAAVEWIIGVGMMLFGINFNLYYFVLLGAVKDVIKDEEMRTYVGIVLSFTMIIFTVLTITQTALGVPIRSVFFTVSSIITTTGYSTVDFGLWGVFPHALLLLLMFIGGCAGSTAGGIKVSRIIVYFKSAIAELKRMGQPRRVFVPTMNGKPIDNKMEKSIANYLIVYVLFFLVLLLCVSFEAGDFITAFSSVAATFNNIGPGLGQVGPTSNFSMYSGFNTFVLSIGMIAGRLEIYPIIMLFSPTTMKAFTRRR